MSIKTDKPSTIFAKINGEETAIGTAEFIEVNGNRRVANVKIDKEYLKDVIPRAITTEQANARLEYGKQVLVSRIKKSDLIDDGLTESDIKKHGRLSR